MDKISERESESLKEKIYEKIKGENGWNHIYFVIAKSKYLLNGEQCGILKITTDLEQFLKYLDGSERPTKITIGYTLIDDGEYDPQHEFLLLLCENVGGGVGGCVGGDVCVPIKISHQFECKNYYSLLPYDDSMKSFIESTPCIECGNFSRQKLVKDDIEQNCQICDKHVEKKAIFECNSCCTMVYYF